jgi:hypothetical protein
MKSVTEPLETMLWGTIIDFETVGEFEGKFPPHDSRHYSSLKPTIFGYITGNVIVQYCAEGYREISDLIEIISDNVPRLKGPFYALNCHFEGGVLNNACGLELVLFDVRGPLIGSKWAIREMLGIPTYDDPYDGEGHRCSEGWMVGDYEKCLKHNRACLLIERDILLNVRSMLGLNRL